MSSQRLPAANLSRSCVHVRTGVKAGGINLNTAQAAVQVKAGVKAGGISFNHAQAVLVTR